MRIWIDADACPRAIRDICYRAADRTKTRLTMVANSWFQIPTSPLFDFVLVPKGLDAADTRIAQECEKGDVVITQDIPLAALVIAKGAHAIGIRGEEHTEANIRERLSIRDFMQGMRDVGVVTGGPREFHDRDKQAFANVLDRLLRKAGRK